MKRSLSGTGSSLVVLVFSVLCLTIFSLISLSAPNIDKAAAEAMAQAVTGYYEADLLAERVYAQITTTNGNIPPVVLGVEIMEWEGGFSFSCPISDSKELFVEIAADGFEILEWRMQDTVEWESDDGLPVWDGD